MRRLSIIVALVAASGLAWGLWRSAEAHRFADELDLARREVQAGRFEQARPWLIALPDERKADPEVADLLGTCEHAAGHYRGGPRRLGAGSPPGSPGCGPRGAGEGADADRRLRPVRRGRADPRGRAGRAGPDPARDPPHALAALLHRVASRGDAQGPRGRLAAVARPGLGGPPPLADRRRDRAGRAGPQGRRRGRREGPRRRPRLARPGGPRPARRPVRRGRRRLGACTGRRPDDPAVWLRPAPPGPLGRRPGRGRADALAHLPADALREADWLDLRAWLAETAGDARAERRALEQRIAGRPGRPGRVRAARRALPRDRPSPTAPRSCGGARPSSTGAKDRYRRLLAESTRRPGFAELAGSPRPWAGRSRPYHWWDLAARRDPARDSRRDRGPGPPRGPTARPRPAAAARRDPRRPPGRPPGRARRGSRAGRRSTAVVPSFRDDAEAAGLRFTFDNGAIAAPPAPRDDGRRRRPARLRRRRLARRLRSSRAARSRPARRRPATGDRLFRNRGDGTFEDATERAGHRRDAPAATATASPSATSTTTAIPTCSSPAGGRTPSTATAATGRSRTPPTRAGLGGDRDWPTSAAFADLDGDGDLDLYVCHYLDVGRRAPAALRSDAERAGDPTSYDYCMPDPFPSVPDHLFRNDGGRFVDVTAEAGIVDRDGRGLGVVAADLDDDGRIDLFVANDTTANFLFRNLGGLRFEEVGARGGRRRQRRRRLPGRHGHRLRRPRRRRPARPGRDQLLRRVDHLLPEPRRRRSSPTGPRAIGLAAPSRYLLGFGIVLPRRQQRRPARPGHGQRPRHRRPARVPRYAMPCQLLLGGDRRPPARRLAPTPARPGRSPGSAAAWPPATSTTTAGSTCSSSAQRRAAGLLPQPDRRAATPSTLRLEGTTSNRDAVGAVVTVDGRRPDAPRLAARRRQLPVGHRPAGSTSASATPTRVDSVEVRWPSGRVDRHPAMEAGRPHVLREGDGTAIP